MNRGCGGEERRVPHEEGAEGALGEERGALRRDVLAASHTVVDLEVQGLVLLLDSGRKKNERKVKGKKSRGAFACKRGGGTDVPRERWQDGDSCSCREMLCCP